MFRLSVVRKVVTQSHGRETANGTLLRQLGGDQRNGSIKTTIQFPSCDRKTVILKRALFLFITGSEVLVLLIGYFLLVSCFDYSSILKMEAVCSTKM
jgi:hypothetical protein